MRYLEAVFGASFVQISEVYVYPNIPILLLTETMLASQVKYFTSHMKSALMSYRGRLLLGMLGQVHLFLLLIGRLSDPTNRWLHWGLLVKAGHFCICPSKDIPVFLRKVIWVSIFAADKFFLWLMNEARLQFPDLLPTIHIEWLGHLFLVERGSNPDPSLNSLQVFWASACAFYFHPNSGFPHHQDKHSGINIGHIRGPLWV